MKGQSQGHPDFEGLYFAKERPRPYGPMLLLNINRKPYMGGPMALSHLTVIELNGQTQGHPDFEALYLVNEPN